jgi:endonuclease/exonuclease/phosphatase (EEP) superfamily protein YafD
MGFCVPWGRWTQSAPAGAPFRVLTCNMHYTHGNSGALDALVVATFPDVVAVQEWPDWEQSALVGDSGWHMSPGNRLFLASRHPIRRTVALGHASMGPHASVTRYELDTPQGLVHLFSLHLASARDGIYDVIHDSTRGPTRLEANSARRRQQSEFVLSQASQLREPVVLVGDFNTPPESVLFAQIWDNYQDSYSLAGLGWGYTFFGARTMVRIDHVLAGQDWYCLRCEVGPFVGSPHRPVIADLVRKRVPGVPPP